MSDPIEIVIRADAGHAIGTGHFGRAAAVAEALLAYDDVAVTLVTTSDAERLVAGYFPRGVRVLALEQADPASVMTALADIGFTPDAVYLDQYGVAAEWEKATSGAQVPLAVLDDLGESRAAQIVVRPVVAQGAPQIAALDGPAYLPLSSHVTRALHSTVSLPRINVCFGGSDPTGETVKAMTALATVEGVDVDVVIGPRTLIDAADMDRFSNLAHLHLHMAPSQAETADLLARADLALGAGGVMQWERLCIGVPTVVVTVARNQLPQVRWMNDLGLISWIGHHDEVTSEAMLEAVTTLIDDPGSRADMAEKGRALVDGRGAIRIAAAVRSLCLTSRPVVAADVVNLLTWRTDPLNWQFNLSSDEKPAFAVHETWMHGKLADQNCCFLIIQQDAVPIGVVRFDMDDTGAALSIYLVPEQHGRKLGLPVYMAAERALLADYPHITQVTSHIHANNDASRRLHVDAGFVVSPDLSRSDWMHAIRNVQSEK